MAPKTASLSNRSTFQILLVLSRALAALRPTLIALLIAGGAKLTGGAEHPISFCNVLFVGNLCAALTVGVWVGFGSLLSDIKATKASVLIGLLVNGCLAALLSALIFLGLQETTVTNAVLLGRLGPVLFAIAGSILLNRSIQRLEWFGFSLIAAGVMAIALAANNFRINQGDLLILLSTLVYAASSLINHLVISKQSSLRLIVFSRNFVSAAIFFAIALILFGPMHFADAFSGSLWILMAIYALVVIVCAQFLWFAAFDQLDAKTIGRLTVISPIFGVTYAFLLNGERPSSTQVATLVVVIAGVVIASFGKQTSKLKKSEESSKDSEDVASA